MTKLLPWTLLLTIPIALVYKHYTDNDDPAFGPTYMQALNESLSLPLDSHGGSPMACAYYLMAPYATALLLYVTARGPYSMGVNVKVQGVLKDSLRLHAGVFLGYALATELAPHILVKLLGSRELFHADANTFVLMSGLSDMFFIGALLFWLMSIQAQVPRWVTWIPLVQSVYNVMNDVRWLQESIVPGGEVVPYRLIIIDGGVFITLLLSYLYAHLQAMPVRGGAVHEKEN